MELIFELIASFIVEVTFEILVELSVQAGLTPIHQALIRRRQSNPALAMMGLVMLGALLGLIVARLLPERLLPAFPVAGVSLVLSPFTTGLVMKAFGDWRRRRGGDPGFLTTFWGAALFALSFALVRWLMVGRVS